MPTERRNEWGVEVKCGGIDTDVSPGWRHVRVYLDVYAGGLRIGDAYMVTGNIGPEFEREVDAKRRMLEADGLFSQADRYGRGRRWTLRDAQGHAISEFRSIAQAAWWLTDHAEPTIKLV